MERPNPYTKNRRDNGIASAGRMAMQDTPHRSRKGKVKSSRAPIRVDKSKSDDNDLTNELGLTTLTKRAAKNMKKGFGFKSQDVGIKPKEKDSILDNLPGQARPSSAQAKKQNRRPQTAKKKRIQIDGLIEGIPVPDLSSERKQRRSPGSIVAGRRGSLLGVSDLVPMAKRKDSESTLCIVEGCKAVAKKQRLCEEHMRSEQVGTHMKFKRRLSVTQHLLNRYSMSDRASVNHLDTTTQQKVETDKMSSIIENGKVVTNTAMRKRWYKKLVTEVPANVDAPAEADKKEGKFYSFKLPRNVKDVKALLNEAGESGDRKSVV